ncbi:MAG: hypothetical protein F4164_12470 [Gemmatimonadales bacterium]|nr:hypothetical protein [Gemmatimonadales bacterium]MYG50147.1 hypothetical protein [Gemmatimonadales bacterium]MYK01356.1 hypothetical protein [Candidatus Palauibacter ramosifaciens]
MDEVVVQRLIGFAGGTTGTVYGRQGKPHLRQQIGGYNRAAHYSPWCVLVDLDADADCAPTLREEWLPGVAPQLCLRVAVRAVEAWLLADAETLAGFLSVRRTRIPANPEQLPDPKRFMIDMARRSRRRAVRKDMVPRPGSGRREGPAYTSRLMEFADTEWRPEVAARHSDSLDRAIRCLRRLVGASHG